MRRSPDGIATIGEYVAAMVAGAVAASATIGAIIAGGF